jgi:hypothetical protein
MGLFSKKKKDEPRVLSPLPEFPKFSEEPKFPTYEPQFKQLPEEKEVDIPIRKPVFSPRSIDLETSRPPASIEEKPLFVKIDRYKEALSSINDIKNKLKEIEVILNKLEEIKNEEDKELSTWHDNIDTIKEKLISVDKKLFEV